MANLRELKEAILRALENAPGAPRRKAHKVNLVGRTHQRGELEGVLAVEFCPEDRALAAKAFEELREGEYIRATYDDLADPENWVVITDAGSEFLRCGLKDAIDLGLEKIGVHLVELRQGMWEAVGRNSPDAARQAAHSARELIDQLLKEGTPRELTSRKQRFLHLMKSRTPPEEPSGSDLEILMANWKVIEAEHDALAKNAHLRGSPNSAAVKGSIEAAERILQLLVG
jgi:hypothetical protein